MLYNPRKTINKSIKEGVTVTAVSIVVIQVLLEEILGIEVPKAQVVEVSAALGIVAGALRGIFNWLKHRKKS